MIRLSNILTYALLLLAGCASYTAKPIDPGAQQTALESRRLGAPAVRQFVERASGQAPPVWPPKVWDLDMLTLAAFNFHPDLDRAQAQRLAAEAATITTGAQPNPTGGISFQRNMDAPAGRAPGAGGRARGRPGGAAGGRGGRGERA